jgi:hypothetical protein
VVGCVGWFITVALSGSLSGLEHGGRQRLRPNSRGYRVPVIDV